MGDNSFRRSAGTVGAACAAISVLCGLFATVLVTHIFLVMGGANPAHGVATFVREWAGGVSLGFDNLFTPASADLRMFLNCGLAAIVWLAFGVVVTRVIRRLTLPDWAK